MMKITALLSAIVLTACVSTPAMDDSSSASMPSENALSTSIANFTGQDSAQYKHAWVDLDNDDVEDAVVLLQGWEC